MSYPVQTRKRIIEGRDGRTRIATYELSPADSPGFVRKWIDGTYAGVITIEEARMRYNYKDRSPK